MSNEVEATQFTPSESYRMKVSQVNAPHIIRSLINLYGNPNRSVLREYATNARDANVAAGNADEPIYVYYQQNSGDDFIGIKDNGPGLDAEGLRNFVEFGSSTKTDDDTQIGAYGFGCKSALAICDTFTVIAVKDGVKRFAVAQRNVDDEVDLNVYKVSETDEPNGVEIRIPNPRYMMKNKVHDLFKVWDSGTVAVNGHLNTCILEAEKWASYGDLRIFRRGYFRDRLMVRMGNEVYHVDLSKLAEYYKTVHLNESDDAAPHGNDAFFALFGFSKEMMNAHMVIDMDIKSLDLSPSRESLRYTDDTLEALTQKIVEVRNTAVASHQEQIDAAESLAEKEDVYLLYRHVFCDDTLHPMSILHLVQLSLEEGASYDISLDAEHEKLKVAKFSMSNYRNTAVMEKVDRKSDFDEDGGLLRSSADLCTFRGGGNVRHVIWWKDMPEAKFDAFSMKSRRNSFSDWMRNTDIREAYAICGDISEKKKWIFENENFVFIDGGDFAKEVSRIRREARQKASASGAGESEVCYKNGVSGLKEPLSSFEDEIVVVPARTQHQKRVVCYDLAAVEGKSVVELQANMSFEKFAERVEKAGKSYITYDSHVERLIEEAHSNSKVMQAHTLISEKIHQTPEYQVSRALRCLDVLDAIARYDSGHHAAMKERVVRKSGAVSLAGFDLQDLLRNYNMSSDQVLGDLGLTRREQMLQQGLELGALVRCDDEAEEATEPVRWYPTQDEVRDAYPMLMAVTASIGFSHSIDGEEHKLRVYEDILDYLQMRNESLTQR